MGDQSVHGYPRIMRAGARWRLDVNLIKRLSFVLTSILFLILSTGCSERDPVSLEVARARIDPLVFDDDYSDMLALNIGQVKEEDPDYSNELMSYIVNGSDF